MVNRKEFYKNSTGLNTFEKRQMFEDIKLNVGLKSNKKFQLKSFIYGTGFATIAAVFVLFFLKNDSLKYKHGKSLDGLNHIYKETIIEVEENFTPISINSNDQKTNDIFLAKIEKLDDLSKAINEIKNENVKEYTKEKVLLRLYKQKLEILEKIILLEERIK